ncbi:bifunctional dTDP-4-dehydrorhamnose 3,5-epimerase family protein/NAD(P)-dependent oxidoreductase [Nocardioides montaniterrae]
MSTDTVTVETTPIPGLLVVRLPVHRDARGWFKEAWQREKMCALGLPDFHVVQSNASFNAYRGVTRGVHAEPWNKIVSVATGRVFAAWVDLREGESYGTTHWTKIDESVAVFVPRGVGNAYQALVDNTAYIYLVDDHWRPGISYPALNLADPTAAIPWPIPLTSSEVELSEKDLQTPYLEDVVPMKPKKTLITGCRGQLGRALASAFPDAVCVDVDELDLTSSAALEAWPWREYGVILNAAAHTRVDAAESSERADAWAANAAAPAALARIATEHDITLVHYSTDYVFSGDVVPGGHVESEPLAPLGVYGQTKAAGDVAVATTPRHYLLRTSWVIGEGHNFVRTMERLAREGVSPAVVDDQVGRLTFTAELVRATSHLLAVAAPFGTYNVTNAGEPRSWAAYARRVFELSGRSPDDVTSTTTAAYGAPAPRPLFSVLNLDKLAATGFVSTDADEALSAYLA